MDMHINRVNLSKEMIYTQICNASQNGAYVAYIRGKRCQTDADWLNEISAVFQFPFYFGNNWNAMDECLQDLEWLNIKAIFVVIDDFSFLFQGDKDVQQLVVRALERMASFWIDAGVPIDIFLNN